MQIKEKNQIKNKSRPTKSKLSSPHKPKPQCYLDMDGLLVNLFDHVAHKMHGKRYQHLSDEEKSEGRIVWEDRSIFHRKFGKIDEFFAKLQPYDTNDAIIETVIEKFDGFYICSKPTKLGQEACIAGKLAWIEEHLLPKYQTHIHGILFPEKKEIFAIGENNLPNVLIDDYKPYIHAWNNAGGIGIRLRSDRFECKKQIKEYLNEEFTKVDIHIKDLLGSQTSPPKTKKRRSLELDGPSSDIL
jgi:hypothetical protein